MDWVLGLFCALRVKTTLTATEMLSNSSASWTFVKEPALSNVAHKWLRNIWGPSLWNVSVDGGSARLRARARGHHLSSSVSRAHLWCGFPGLDLPTHEVKEYNCSTLDHHVRLRQNISARRIIADPHGNPKRIDRRLKELKVQESRISHWLKGLSKTCLHPCQQLNYCLKRKEP